MLTRIMQLKLKLVLLHKAKGVRLNLKHHMSQGSLKRRNLGKLRWMKVAPVRRKNPFVFFVISQVMASWNASQNFCVTSVEAGNISRANILF
jgi:hypothetical protein